MKNNQEHIGHFQSHAQLPGRVVKVKSGSEKLKVKVKMNVKSEKQPGAHRTLPITCSVAWSCSESESEKWK